MTETNAKIHVLVDETLGGIKREYVEVDRKAEVGEKIVIVDKMYPDDIYKKGDIFTVDRDFYSEYSFVESDGAVSDTNSSGIVYHVEYRVLEPTDIVHIDGGRYKMVARRVEVGEKVIVLESEEYPKGFTADVEYFDDFYDDGSFYLTEGIGGNFYIDATSERYRVLVPVETETAETDEPQPADLIDVVAKLTEEVSKLKRKVGDLDTTIERHENEIDTLHKDNRTLGEELARVTKQVGEKTQSNVDALAEAFVALKRAGL